MVQMFVLVVLAVLAMTAVLYMASEQPDAEMTRSQAEPKEAVQQSRDQNVA